MILMASMSKRTESTKPLDISAPLTGGTAKTALGYENGKDEIRNTSDNIIFLFMPL